MRDPFIGGGGPCTSINHLFTAKYSKHHKQKNQEYSIKESMTYTMHKVINHIKMSKNQLIKYQI